jgi:hypothetical protein
MKTMFFEQQREVKTIKLYFMSAVLMSYICSVCLFSVTLSEIMLELGRDLLVIGFKILFLYSKFYFTHL